MKRIIQTDRLVLRPAYIGDAGRVVQIMEYDISKWLIPVPDPTYADRCPRLAVLSAVRAGALCLGDHP